MKKINLKTMLGLLVICFTLVFLVICLGKGNFIILYYIDLPSILMIGLLSIGVILVTNVRDKKSILDILGKTIIPIGFFVALMALVMLFSQLENISTIGPNLAVALLSLLYSVIVKIVVEILKVRLEKGEERK